jgi:hypothetical protein
MLIREKRGKFPTDESGGLKPFNRGEQWYNPPGQFPLTLSYLVRLTGNLYVSAIQWVC